MQYKRLFILWYMLLVGSLNVLHAAPRQTTVGEIKKSLACQCECNMTVEACEGAMACESADKLTAKATQYVEQGMSKDAIFSAFIRKYGESILAAPAKKGFNLTVWILPFAAILIAGFGIVRVLQRWVRQEQKRGARVKTAMTKANNSKYEQKLDEVLRRLD
ncbi:MAG: cytochrome c-type biogenesis protein CcmH [bacterium]